MEKRNTILILRKRERSGDVIEDVPTSAKKMKMKESIAEKPKTQRSGMELGMIRIHQLQVPDKLKERIAEKGGTEAVLVIEKKLYETDVRPPHGRLSIPLTQIRVEFLRDEDKNELKNHKKIKGCRIIQSYWDECRVTLTQWDMRKDSGKVSTTYNLISGWNEILKSNNLKKGMEVQLWSFYVDSQLWFALLKS